MEGQWWVTHGFNPVYDCLPCQRLTFSKLNASSWLYDSKYQAITLEGAPRDFEVQAVFPWPADGTAQAIAFTYEYEGMTHGAFGELWWVVVTGYHWSIDSNDPSRAHTTHHINNTNTTQGRRGNSSTSTRSWSCSTTAATATRAYSTPPPFSLSGNFMSPHPTRHNNRWNYEGALVLSRQRSNTEEHLGMAAEAFARIGLAFPAQFCALDNAACEGF